MSHSTNLKEQARRGRLKEDFEEIQALMEDDLRGMVLTTRILFDAIETVRRQRRGRARSEVQIYLDQMTAVHDEFFVDVGQSWEELRQFRARLLDRKR